MANKAIYLPYIALLCIGVILLSYGTKITAYKGIFSGLLQRCQKGRFITRQKAGRKDTRRIKGGEVNGRAEQKGIQHY